MTAPAVCFSIQVPRPEALQPGACDFDCGSRQGPFEGPATRKASGSAGGYLLDCRTLPLPVVMLLSWYGDRQRSLPHQQPTVGTQQHRSIAFPAGRLRVLRQAHPDAGRRSLLQPFNTIKRRLQTSAPTIIRWKQRCICGLRSMPPCSASMRKLPFKPWTASTPFCRFRRDEPSVTASRTTAMERFLCMPRWTPSKPLVPRSERHTPRSVGDLVSIAAALSRDQPHGYLEDGSRRYCFCMRCNASERWRPACRTVKCGHGKLKDFQEPVHFLMSIESSQGDAH